MQTNSSIGRYAPSPTGDQHLGNLRTALLAWLKARSQGGQFLLRMEDLDTPRVVAGSADKILRDLEWLGIDWDGDVVYQSQRTPLYQQALEVLREKSLIYPCFCSRKDIQIAASAPHAKVGVYPKTCTDLSVEQICERSNRKSPASRVRVDGSLADDCGDFVVHRADGLFAYQLAVVVDDLEQGITEVVRGADLLDSTARQRYLAEKLNSSTMPIRYFHAPLMMDHAGNRMAKRDGSCSVADWKAKGKNAEQLVAHLISSLNLVGDFDALSTAELLAELDESRLLACFE